MPILFYIQASVIDIALIKISDANNVSELSVTALETNGCDYNF